jgi:hypothetical protein
MSVLRKIVLVQHVRQGIGGKHSSQQECDDDIKTTGASSHGPL